jgi:hypothetical protein
MDGVNKHNKGYGLHEKYEQSGAPKTQARAFDQHVSVTHGGSLGNGGVAAGHT